MKKLIAICLVISLAFVLVACSEPVEYEVVGTLPEITQGDTDTETFVESETNISSELMQPDESAGAE